MLGRGGRRNQGGGGGGAGTFLEVLNNLSDLDNIATARINLGFVAQPAGQVLIGDGSTTFTSDPDFFFDTATKRVGIGTNSPDEQLHVFKATGSAIALVETQSTGNGALLIFKASRTAGADLALNDIASRIATLGMAGASYVDLAFIDGVYTGNGTTQIGDLVFMTANAGAPAEKFRIKGTGELRTQLSAGAAYIDAEGDISSLTTVSVTELGYLDGVTSAIQTQLNAITGSAITSLTGDVVASGPGAAASTIQANVVSNSKLAQMAQSTIKGRAASSGTGDPVDLTATQATAILNVFVGDSGSGGTKGLVPAPSTGDAGKFLSGAATWVSLSAAVNLKAGKVDLVQGTTTKAIVFATTRTNANYTPLFKFFNSIDDDPIGIPVRFIDISSTGFTAEWDDALPTGNYDGYWGILEHYDP